MSGTNKTIPRLWAGFAVIMAAAGVLLWRLGAAHFITGIAGGIAVAYLGLLMYYLLIPRPGSKPITFIRGYIPGALLRYIIMIGAFCAVVFVLRINAIGVLLGIFLGMMVSTFISLNHLRQSPHKHPEV